MSEALVDRVAGAVRFVSAVTGRPVTSRLLLSADKAMTWRRNRSGDYIVWRAEGLDAYTGHDPALTDEQIEELFQQPPAAPAEKSLRFEVTVEDPGGELVGRRFLLELPRAVPDLFRPVEVTLYPAAGARGAGAGAELYAFVHDGSVQEGRLPGALVTVTIDGVEVARGLTGPTGEALVAVPRLASFVPASSGSDIIMVSEHEASVRAAVNPALLKSENGRWTLAGAPDPDRDFSGPDVISVTADIQLSAGRALGHSFQISLP